MDMFDDMMGGDSSDGMDLMDFDLPLKKKEKELQVSGVSDGIDFGFERAPVKREREITLKRNLSDLAINDDECQTILNKLQKFCSK
jgi:hypothetical protein